jgi:hypothetical protein
VIVEFAPQAAAAIQAVYDDPRLRTLADRVEEIIDALEKGSPYPAQVRARRMQVARLWYVPVRGSGEALALLWHERESGDARVVWAGPEI